MREVGSQAKGVEDLCQVEKLKTKNRKLKNLQKDKNDNYFYLYLKKIKSTALTVNINK